MKPDLLKKPSLVLGTALLATAVMLSGCDDDDDDDDGPATKTVTMTVSAGNPVAGSACKIYAINTPATTLDTATTDSAGMASFDIPTGAKLTEVECTGGNFTPKVTAGTLKSLLDAVVASSGVVTPLTTLIAELAEESAATLDSVEDLDLASLLTALGLPGTITPEALLGGTLTGDALLQVNIVATALANNPSLLATLSTEASNGAISATTAAALNVAIQTEIADADPADVPATTPTAVGGTVSVTGGA